MPGFAIRFVAALLLVSGAAVLAQTPAATDDSSLAQARHGFKTKIVLEQTAGFPVDEPPRGLDLVKYHAPLGDLPAYVSTPPAAGKGFPAIIWIVGGFSNSISDVAWTPSPADNDQSASIFRQKGIVTMYPSLRGGNNNPGFIENFYGEVDDVLAAADYLAAQSFVDPSRIYLGGHSTGGTLALLVAECSPRFRSVFAFGPVDEVMNYGPAKLFFDVQDKKEALLRSPGEWLNSIHSPVFVFEGTDRPSNIGALRTLARSNHNPSIVFNEVNNATHFSGLRPVSGLISDKILQDTASAVNIHFTKEEIAAAIKGAARGTK